MIGVIISPVGFRYGIIVIVTDHDHNLAGWMKRWREGEGGGGGGGGGGA